MTSRIKHIPVVDFAALGSETGSQSALSAACESWGFFQLVNHGIDPAERERFLDALQQFFALSPYAKNGVRRTRENAWGYYDNELTKNRRDWKEIFDVGHAQTDNAHQPQWPPLPGFQELMLDWFTRCESISRRLLTHICTALGVPAASLDGFFEPSNSSFLRLNHYPICPDPADPAIDNRTVEDERREPLQGHLGIHPHTDSGALTVLVQDRVAGLQVQYAGGWSTVVPEDNALIINIGDLMQVWSNDRFRAPVHRVLANAHRARFSAPFFFNPAFTANCIPLTQDEAPQYRRLNWGEFRQSRAAGDYADLGHEIQVSDFLISKPADHQR